ncbi:MAG: hypothetical protein ACE5PM_03345 [Candidatus Hydrothermarchaeales archaeon]
MDEKSEEGNLKVIPREEFEKLSLVDQWRYLIKKRKEIEEKVERLKEEKTNGR